MLIMVVISSCSIENDEGVPFTYEIAKVNNVQFPEFFVFGQTHDIVVQYEQPSTCHLFSGFEVVTDLNVRTVNAVTAVLATGDCMDLENHIEEQVLQFRATSNGSFVFKFFAGLNPNGEPQYIEREIFVQQ